MALSCVCRPGWSRPDAVLPPRRAQSPTASSVGLWIHRVSPLRAAADLLRASSLTVSCRIFSRHNEKNMRVASGFYFPPLELREMWLLAAAPPFLLPPSPFSAGGGRVEDAEILRAGF